MGKPLSLPDFVGEVRSYVRDFEELNRLIAGEETSNRMIEYCVQLGIDEFNESGHETSYGITDFPSRGILLQLTIIHILTSVGILKSRNRFNYSDGGWTSETEIQDQLYQNWIQLIRSQVGPRMQHLKVRLNITGGWGGGVSSEYGLIHGWYGEVV